MSLKLLFTPASLAELIEKSVRLDNITYIEALCNICNDHGLEHTDIIPVLSAKIRDKLEAEAISLNMLPRKTAKLY